MTDESNDTEDVSCMKLDPKKILSSNEELALFMHRFNLDWETVEIMPAFESHCKELFRHEDKEDTQ